MAQTTRPQGKDLADFVQPPHPGPAVMTGRFARLERLDADAHAADLYAANQGGDQVWDYLPYGPFAQVEDYREWQAAMASKSDPFFYAIRDLASDKVLGIASFLRIDPANGGIEIGHIQLSPPLQRTVAASEALMLMIRWAFETGYRRVEWKCNAMNAASRRAALRLGFSFEGVFRQHLIVKGRNRDSAWFSIIDGEWPALQRAHDAWLSPGNFGGEGRQAESLSDLTARALPGRRDPG